MIAYACGVFDILRAKDLQNLDRKMQLSRQDGSSVFGLGIYDSNLCENLGINTPLKSLEDRMAIMKHIRGVDFVFPVSTLHEDVLKDVVRQAYTEYTLSQNSVNEPTDKKYEFGYAPGTYDLFHAGHLEHLTLVTKQCEKLIVGIKSDELVESHKHRKPVISAEERMEIIRYFKFVYDAYIYHTRDLHVANDWFKSKYGKSLEAIFYGSDLKKDFSNITDLNIIFTPRDSNMMQTKSSTAYRKIQLGRIEGNFSTGPHPANSPLKMASGTIEHATSEKDGKPKGEEPKKTGEDIEH